MLNRFFTNYFSLIVLGVMLTSTGIVFAQEEKCELPGQPIDQVSAKDIQALIDPVQIKAERDSICKAIQACQKFNDEEVSKSGTNCFQGRESSNKEKMDKKGSCGLTSEEYYLLNRYTDSLYDCINKYLRKKSKSYEEIDTLKNILNRALDKLPNYEGYVVRGASLSKEAQENHAEGKIVTYDAFTSTSTQLAFDTKDQFIIFSRTGKPIMGIAVWSTEREVLFKSGSQFKVIDTYEKNDKNYYVMKEVVSGESEDAQKEEEKRILADLRKKYHDSNGYDHDSFECKDIQKQAKENSLKQKYPPRLPSVNR